MTAAIRKDLSKCCWSNTPHFLSTIPPVLTSPFSHVRQKGQDKSPEISPVPLSSLVHEQLCATKRNSVLKQRKGLHILCWPDLVSQENALEKWGNVCVGVVWVLVEGGGGGVTAHEQPQKPIHLFWGVGWEAVPVLWRLEENKKQKESGVFWMRCWLWRRSRSGRWWWEGCCDSLWRSWLVVEVRGQNCQNLIHTMFIWEEQLVDPPIHYINSVIAP